MGSLALLLLGSTPLLAATTFTSNTTISAGNTNYDGTDIVVTNCTLTVDGQHSFSSLLVQAGGVVTHSFAANGTLQYLTNVVNEPHVLVGTFPWALLNSNVISATVAVTDDSGTILYVNGTDYTLSSPDGISTDIERTTNSTIAYGETVLVSYEAVLSTTPVGLNLAIAGNVEVEAGGAINANGIGYGGGYGTGVGHSNTGLVDGGGAGYGGLGGIGSSNAPGGVSYGSFTQPSNLGSGGGVGFGGVGGAGGGLIQITAGGNVIVDGVVCANGANGTNSRSGGGSGGSIAISGGAALLGAGSITANGGNGEPTHGGGGSGGRIALSYASSEFTGPMTAYGGTGANIGGAGTVYTITRGQNGLLLCDNGGQAGTNTPVAVSGSTINVLIQGNARAVPTGNWSVGNLTIASNGLLLASAYNVQGGLGTMNLTADGDITIEAGGAIVADGAGYSGGQGQGAGRNLEFPYWSGGGGGYGGTGANGNPTNAYGGLAYGNQTDPTALGSGGGTFTPYSYGGAGGGAVEIYCYSGFIIVDGRISANGNNGSGIGGGGGSGGSIWLNGGTLLGAGSITANGGNGADSIGGGGGGGRIQIAPTANMFEGAVSAYGGGGAGWGGAGTVLIQGLNKNPQLVLDNNGHAGTNTLLQTASGTDLVVQGGAVGSAQTSLNFANLVLNSNGWLTPYFFEPGSADTFNFTFNGNATIQAGAGIIADLAGNMAGQGQGAGHSYSVQSSNYCSGAGHGGYGGSSFGGYTGGGAVYDSVTQPTISGSGGGIFQGSSIGGAGGGVIRLTITGALELDGLISANAGNGIGFAGGGGSGGSIWLAVGALSGGGSITAKGGNGVDDMGGGGGGGMIYVPCSYNGFAGTISAAGGTGATPGGAGQVLIQVNGQNGQLILDNAGQNGSPTPLAVSGVDLTLRNGAIASPGTSLSLGNLLIEANSRILITNGVNTLSCKSATIQPGGGIIADGAGYAAGTGPGTGHYNQQQQNTTNYPCSGAGHGGYGGNALAASPVSGGSPYDLTALPSQMGSGGGSYSSYAVGGAGGGVLEIIVSGVMENDGLISANGGNGFGLGGGGGSGGSIQLTAGTLSGAGAILANGGNGVDSTGGGGAGGCIAVNSTANLFAGTIAAYGGGGAAWGGAGTVYIQPNSPAAAQLILDNAGNYGAPTPIQAAASAGAVVLRNGAVGFEQSSPQTCASLSISSNAWLMALPGNGVISPAPQSPGLVSMTVTGSVMIQAGGGIVTDSVGNPGGAGPGEGHFSNIQGSDYPCSGGGYGGYGASSGFAAALGGATYTGTMSPTVLGSGGGTYTPYSLGGAGGGSIRLIINGTMNNEGIISANGGNGSGLGGGGGSGGSIFLTLGTLLGGGAVRANGGNGVDSVGGGGGGGRISVTFNTNAFTGPVTAYGGSGANWGGAGTVYVKTNSQTYALVTMDNGGHRGTNTTFDAGSINLLIANGAIGQWSQSSLENLFIRSNGTLTFAASTASQTVEVNGGATIDAGGAISADGTGYGPAQGTGAGVSSTAGVCGGGGHGGYGAANLAGYGGAYGSIQSPITAGSGGGNGSGNEQLSLYGGAGGGAVHLEIEGTLTVNGRVSAAGGNGNGDSGGGAGGSLWIGAGTLLGSGVISANGGTGSDLGGGGAGGRISVGGFGQTGSGPMNFSGTMTATGGSGYANGGAGTIYLSGPVLLQQVPAGGQLLVDNGGAAGTNTPVSTALGAPSQGFNLIIQNGAVVCPQTNGTFPTLNNLTVVSGGQLIGLPGPSTLDLLVLSNADVTPSGAIVVDGMGYAQGQGPGAGTNRNGYGSGAGYGGVGGASEGGPGGPTYGSAQQPVDFGSGGGLGQGPLAGGSSGGGALRLSVGGILTVDGQISAEGSAALQSSAGGGSGGSLWVTAGTLVGTGLFAADGGTGDFYGGGGGGAGGRIALYASVNDFSGQLSTLGAGGYSSGANGTTVSSATIPPLQIISSSPSGIVSNGVSYVDLYFNDALKQGTLVGSFSLTTPSGPLSNGVTSLMISSTHYRASFPIQSASGSYTFTVVTNYITDLYGHPMAQAYTGSFTILLPQVVGMVTDAGGHPVPGVLMQAAGLSPATTDVTGHYALSFLPGTVFTVQPSLAGMAFVPSAHGYTNVTVSTANQNYLAVGSVAPALKTAFNGANLTLSWSAISNVTYQVYSSTDLVNWQPYGNPVTATGTAQVLLPTGTNGLMCFRVQATY